MPHSPGVRRGVAAYALDASRAARLWAASETLVDRAARSRHPQLVSDADHVALERLVTEAAWRVDDGRSDTLHELFYVTSAIEEGVVGVQVQVGELSHDADSILVFAKRCVRSGGRVRE